MESLPWLVLDLYPIILLPIAVLLEEETRRAKLLLAFTSLLEVLFLLGFIIYLFHSVFPIQQYIYILCDILFW